MSLSPFPLALRHKSEAHRQASELGGFINSLCRRHFWSGLKFSYEHKLRLVDSSPLEVELLSDTPVLVHAAVGVVTAGTALRLCR